jgi:hypothetical protein
MTSRSASGTFHAVRAAMAALLLHASCAQGAISPDESRLLNELDARRALADIRHLSAEVVSTPSGLGAGTAVSGSQEEKALATEIARIMTSIGLDVRLEEFPVRAYQYGPVTFTANGAPIDAISLHSAGGTFGTRDGVPYARGDSGERHTLHGRLLDAKEGYAPDYDALGDVRGRFVLVHRELRDWPEAQITEAARRGAAAIVFYDYPNSADQVDALRQDSMWAHDQIPAVAISRRSSRALLDRLRAGPVDMALENRADVADGRSQNVIGVIRGSALPDEWVIVSAHYDRWFHGAGDNTSGVAAVLEAARAFVGSGLRPRRSIAFIATGSEEAGLDDAERDWLAGSHAFVTRHPEILRRAALIFNVDLIGWTSPNGTLMSTPDVAAHQRAVLADLGYDTRISITVPTTSAIDAWNYGVVGGAAMNHLWRATFTGEHAYFPIYHTQLDTYQTGHFDNLPMDLRLVALSLWRAADAGRLPVALTAIADFVDPLLAADAVKVPDVDFEGVRSALRDFRRAAAYVEAVDDPARNDEINWLVESVRHELVPWLYISNSDFEQAVRTAEFAQRAAVLDVVVSELRAGHGPRAVAALGELYEGRQCLRLSPAAYADEHGYWASDSGWATRFQQRPPPPPPAFDAGCQAIRGSPDEQQRAVPSFTAARADASRSVAEAVALLTVKLSAASRALGADLRDINAVSTHTSAVRPLPSGGDRSAAQH